MLHEIPDDLDEASTEALLAGHAERLAGVVGEVGVAAAAESTGLPVATIEQVASGDEEAVAALDVAEASALLALADGAPSATEIADAARDELLFGMTAGVLNVDIVAGEVDLDLDPKEVQAMLEGRHPMTIREYAAVQSVVAGRSP